MRIAVIFGTRPEAIKMAPVVLALRRAPGVVCQVCVTGQHRQMLDQVLEVFGLVPDADLNLMQPNQTLAELTARAVTALDVYLGREQPDLVLVQGDTTTVFCATLAAFYRGVRVGHVEAGLRTWDLRAPWPEEANRVLTTRLATLHFAPTEGARQNLLREGVSDHAITVTGNTVIDALLLALDKVRAHPPTIPELPEFLQPVTAGRSGVAPLVLITGHRRENFGEAFENVCRALRDLAQSFPEVHWVYPVHLNPNVRGPVMEILGVSPASPGPKGAPADPRLRSAHRNIHLIEPLSYLSFVGLMDRATLILTDSGGVQEEAPSLGKPVLVMRDTTERPEGVAAGTVRLVGADRQRIVTEVSRLLTEPSACAAMARKQNPYGDGHAAARIVAACTKLLAVRP